MSLSSYLFERHQAIAYHLSQRLATWRASYRRMQTRYAVRPALCDPLEPRMLMSAAPITFTDASGDTVTITLTGPGSISVSGIDSGNADPTGITLSDTTASSVLKITVTNADKLVIPTTTLGFINLGAGQLGTLSAANVDLTGTGISGGAESYIKSITLRDVLNGADIDLDGGATKGSMKLVARRVTDGTDINVAMAISTASFAEYGDGTLTASKISALKVTGIKNDSLHVGNFEADLTLTGNKGTILGSATIAGGVTDAVWTIGGSVGSLAITGVLNGSTINITGTLGSVKAADLTNVNWNITGGRINKITTAGNLTGTYTAISLGTVSVGGNMNATLNLGSATTKDSSSVLGSLTVKGSLAGSISAAHGSIGTVSAASASGLTLAVGSGLINKIVIAGNMASSTLTARRIGTWSVGGNLSGTTATISGAGYSGYAVLNSLSVTGDVTTTYIKATLGGIGTIKANSIADSSFEFPDGRVGKITVAGDVSKGYVQGITTLSTIVAQSIGAWTVGDDVTDVNVALGSSIKISGKQALDSLKVTGDISGTHITATYGGAGTINAYSITTSDLKFADGRIGTIRSTTTHSGGAVNAMSIGTWNVGTTLNEINAALATNAKVNKSYALTDLIVGGAITDTVVDADYGAVRTISGGSISGSSFKFGNGRIVNLNSGQGHSGGSIEAMSIGTWKVGGDLTGVTATLATDSSMHNRYSVTDLLVTGTISGVNIQAQYGGVRTISAQSIGTTDSTIYFADGYIATIKTNLGVTGLDLKAESIGNWTAGGNLNDVTATLGNLTTKGYKALENLTVSGDVTNTSIIASEGGAGNIWVNNLSNSTISFVNGRINWLDVAGNMNTTDSSIQNQVKAFSIGKWYVDGNLGNTKATFGANDNRDYLALGTLSVGGAMTDVDIEALYDAADSISAASISGGSFNFGSDIGSITTTQNMSGTDVTARRVVNWTVGGDLSDVVAVLGNDTTDRDGRWLTNVIENLTVSGTINLCRIVADGSLGRVTAEKMTNTHMYIGYSYNGTDYDLSAQEDIQSLTITGDGSKTPAFVDNVIQSYTISNIAVNYPATSSIETKWIAKLSVTTYPGGSTETKTITNVSATPAGLSGLSFTWLTT